MTAARVEGTLAALDRPDLALDCSIDRELALAVRDAIRAEGVPVVGVSFGGNMVEQSAMPIDWGVFVPLWFTGGRGGGADAGRRRQLRARQADRGARPGRRRRRPRGRRSSRCGDRELRPRARAQRGLRKM